MQNSTSWDACSGINRGLLSNFSLVATESLKNAPGRWEAASPLRRGGCRSTRRCERFTASVLVAEDDPFIRLQNTQFLERAGYHVMAVEDGLAAWDALHAGHFDLLVTDNDMPNLGGVELVAKLRLAENKLPIILASGSAEFFSTEEYRWLEFSAFLQKPYTGSKLLQAVERILQPNFR